MINPSEPQTPAGTESVPAFERTPVILIADDDPSMRLVLRHAMEQSGYHVIEVTNGLEAVQAANEQIPDLILMDAVMPQMDGFRATQEIKKIKQFVSTPVLIATSLDDDQSIARAFEVGASDYVTKPFNWSVLKRRISRMLYAADAERKIHHLAYHDSLTGLPNRILFMDRITQAISRAQREQQQFAVLYIDVDHFKVINDSMGHAAGDQLLKIVAQRLRDVLRKSDTIARPGGDEFTVILENLSEPARAAHVAKNILNSLDIPILLDEKTIHIGGSIGIALYPQDGEDYGCLLKNADIAMYKAKQLGRQTFQFYAAEMSQLALHRLELEGQIRQALKAEEFIVYYQPKINLLTNACCGVEALVRWNHPQRGLIQPDEFIPLAEETGLITQLDEWVMMVATEQFQQWSAKGYKLDNLSVNVSAKHFKEGELSRFCEYLLESTQLPASVLEIELTESALLENKSHAKVILREISQLGINIALDDFGTGYASMTYLKEFPFDTVKIDRSFVQGIPDDIENTAIVKALIQLSAALKLNLVAEGVETQSQQQFLTQNGCNYAQGYLWSKPVSAAEIEKILEQQKGIN